MTSIELRPLLRHGLLSALFCCAIALALTLAGHGPWDEQLVYSLAIGRVSWLGIDLGRMLLTGEVAGAVMSNGEFRALPQDESARLRTVEAFGRLAAAATGIISEIEINPLLIGPDGAVAVDCLTTLSGYASHAQ